MFLHVEVALMEPKLNAQISRESPGWDTMVGGCYVQPEPAMIDVSQRMRDDHVTQFAIDLEPEFV